MRVLRPAGPVLAILTAGLLLLASPAGATQPLKLTDHITDPGGVLTDSGKAAVNSAIDQLYRERHIQLWVVYVDNFSRFKPENWSGKTRDASGMGTQDVVLAVATNTKASVLDVSPDLKALKAADVDRLQHGRIDPAVAAGNWSGAAVAAADGVEESTSKSKWAWLLKFALVAVGVAILFVVLLVVLLLRHRRRRRAAGHIASGERQSNQVPGSMPEASLPQALSTADARFRQVSDYISKHRDSVGAEARARLDEAKGQLAAAHGKQSGDADATAAVAHAARASALAAQAQTLANADVQAAHSPRRRRS